MCGLCWCFHVKNPIVGGAVFYSGPGYFLWWIVSSPACFSGSLCDSWSSQGYLLPVLDTVLVRKSWRRRGFGLQMLEDFCSTFHTEKFLGVSSPLSPSMVAGQLWFSIILLYPPSKPIYFFIYIHTPLLFAFFLSRGKVYQIIFHIC